MAIKLLFSILFGFWNWGILEAFLIQFQETPALGIFTAASRVLRVDDFRDRRIFVFITRFHGVSLSLSLFFDHVTIFSWRYFTWAPSAQSSRGLKRKYSGAACSPNGKSKESRGNFRPSYAGYCFPSWLLSSLSQFNDLFCCLSFLFVSSVDFADR